MIMVGKDRGKKGKIEKIFPKAAKVFLPGLNIYKKHAKKQDEKHPGGIIEFSRPFSIANVAFICPKCGKTSRLGFKVSTDKKVRVCKKCKMQV